MGKWRTFFHYLTLGIVDSNEEHERKNTPCYFDERITFDEFKKIAIDVAKPIKRLHVFVNNQFVTGEVKTVSGINSWTFEIDFNDFGKITGDYWFVYSGNTDSDIPSNYAKKLSNAIRYFIENKSYESCEEATDYDEDLEEEHFCPNCGAVLDEQPGFNPSNDSYTCKKCGQKLYDSNIYDGENFEGIYWYCDSCNALLNKQRNFNDKNGFWYCSECGHKNIIDEDNIVED